MSKKEAPNQLAAMEQLVLTGAITMDPPQVILGAGSVAMTLSEWEALGNLFAGAKSAACWFLGDWWNLGESLFGDERFQGFSEVTQCSKESIERYGRTAANVAPAQRYHPQLTFSHHRIVEALPAAEQSVWLERAIAEQWSCAQLKEHLGLEKPQQRLPETRGQSRLKEIAELISAKAVGPDDGYYRVPQEYIIQLRCELGYE